MKKGPGMIILLEYNSIAPLMNSNKNVISRSRKKVIHRVLFSKIYIVDVMLSMGSKQGDSTLRLNKVIEGNWKESRNMNRALRNEIEDLLDNQKY